MYLDVFLVHYDCYHSEALVAILEDKLEEKIKPIRQIMDELKDTVNFINDKFDSIERHIGGLEEKYQGIQQENRFRNTEVLRLSKVSNDLISEINDIEQYSRHECVEITGLSMEETEDTTDLSRQSDNRIYISESLSPRNKELFKHCLKFRKDQRFKFIWTHSGRIYLRKDKDCPARVITCKGDLDELSR